MIHPYACTRHYTRYTQFSEKYNWQIRLTEGLAEHSSVRATQEKPDKPYFTEAFAVKCNPAPYCEGTFPESCFLYLYYI